MNSRNTAFSRFQMALFCLILIASMLISAFIIFKPYKHKSIEAKQSKTKTQTDISIINKPNLEETTTEPFVIYYNVPMPKEMVEYTVSVCEEYNLNPALVFAVMEVESNFDFFAISNDGNCIGIMQVHSINYEGLKVRIGTNNLKNPQENIEAGCYILSKLLDKYPFERAIVCYNEGEFGRQDSSTEYSRKVIKAMTNYQ